MALIINPEIKIPNFILLRIIDGKGPIHKVTICKNTLIVLAEEILKEFPEEWSPQNFYDLLDEGKRFFANRNDDN
ncbi:hypothetical protein ACFYU8_18760 [Brevibacillus sp. NPDC003359]|uniref:hypothetical protein n=1 Tax=unclassified Brevibacillus TaxID=2684853 RepID=UPI0036CD45DE